MPQDDRAFVGAIPEIYERRLGPMLFEPFARDLARRFEGFEGDILETAAGTGRLTRPLAEAAPKAAITATDLNEPMLAKGRELVPAPNVRWQVADAQALPFADASFDAVACQFGVMFFPDKAAGFAEAHRMLRPGGRFVFNVWDELAANDVSRLAQAAVAAAFPAGPPRFLARTPYGYNDRNVIAAALAAAGFQSIGFETVRLSTPAESATAAAEGLCLGTPLRGEIEAHGPEALDRALHAAEAALTEMFGSGAISPPGQAVLVTAQA